MASCKKSIDDIWQQMNQRPLYSRKESFNGLNCKVERVVPCRSIVLHESVDKDLEANQPTVPLPDNAPKDVHIPLQTV
jgi:hypothetical protein